MVEVLFALGLMYITCSNNCRNHIDSMCFYDVPLSNLLVTFYWPVRSLELVTIKAIQQQGRYSSTDNLCRQTIGYQLTICTICCSRFSISVWLEQKFPPMCNIIIIVGSTMRLKGVYIPLCWSGGYKSLWLIVCLCVTGVAAAIRPLAMLGFVWPMYEPTPVSRKPLKAWKVYKFWLKVHGKCLYNIYIALELTHLPLRTFIGI